MCLDNIEEIAAAVEAAKRAKAELDWFESTEQVSYNVQDMTPAETRLVLTARVERAESRLRDLGFRGPVVKPAAADPGDAQRTIASNRTGSDR